MIVLGSTGSIGTNALCVAKAFHIPIETLVAGKNIALLQEQIRIFKPKNVVVADKNLAHALKDLKIPHLFYGAQGILDSLENSSSSLVLNALVGFLGLEPTLHSLKLKKQVALANKESLVIGGHLIDSQNIIPVDSEHFSLWFLLHRNPLAQQLILTASGGAFRDLPLQDIHHQRAHAALRHPNWIMGQKITIDSATMMNKIFEILEAYWLFGTKNIQAFIERNSIVHALVGFYDGSFQAHIAKNDMRLPLAYAILGESIFQQERKEYDSLFEPLSLTQLSSISFEEISTQRYPLWNLKDTLLKNPSLGVIVNASNEVAIAKFLKDEIIFGNIAEIIFACLQKFSTPHALTFDAIKEIDKEVRLFADSLFKNQKC